MARTLDDKLAQLTHERRKQNRPQARRLTVLKARNKRKRLQKFRIFFCKILDAVNKRMTVVAKKKPGG